MKKENTVTMTAPDMTMAAADAVLAPPTKLIVDMATVLKRAGHQQAWDILIHADGLSDVPSLALAYRDHPDFRLWYIPLACQPVFDRCVADLVEFYPDDGTVDDPALDADEEDGHSVTRMTPETAATFLREEWGMPLGYVALVGPVICALSIGDPTHCWGQEHGLGTQIIQHLQRRFARQGLLALNVVGAQNLLTRSGFAKLPLPPGVDNPEYDDRPFMAWKMSPAQRAHVMQRYQITWEQL